MHHYPTQKSPRNSRKRPREKSLLRSQQGGYLNSSSTTCMHSNCCFNNFPVTGGNPNMMTPLTIISTENVALLNSQASPRRKIKGSHQDEMAFSNEIDGAISAAISSYNGIDAEITRRSTSSATHCTTLNHEPSIGIRTLWSDSITETSISCRTLGSHLYTSSASPEYSIHSNTSSHHHPQKNKKKSICGHRLRGSLKCDTAMLPREYRGPSRSVTSHCEVSDNDPFISLSRHQPGKTSSDHLYNTTTNTSTTPSGPPLHLLFASLSYSMASASSSGRWQCHRKFLSSTLILYLILICFSVVISCHISLDGILVEASESSIHAVDADFPLSSWMDHFAPNISSIPLTQLVIPGTHDSGSYSISPKSGFILGMPEWMRGAKLMQPIMKWQQTQGNTLYEQLNQGIRYLDIRVMSFQEEFYACHSAVRGEQIDELLAQVSQFMKEQPQEIVLFDVHQFLGFRKEHHKKLIELLQKYFPEEMVVSREKHHARLDTLTAGNLWNGTERLVIFYRDPDICSSYPNYVWSNEGSTEEDISLVNGFIYRPFSPGVRDVHQLSEFMRTTLRKRTSLEKFYVLPATLYWNQWNVIWGFFCGNAGCWGLSFPTSHRQFNEGYSHMIYEQVSDTLLKERKRVNIVMMDWSTTMYTRLLVRQNLQM